MDELQKLADLLYKLHQKSAKKHLGMSGIEVEFDTDSMEAYLSVQGRVQGEKFAIPLYELPKLVKMVEVIKKVAELVKEVKDFNEIPDTIGRFELSIDFTKKDVNFSIKFGGSMFTPIVSLDRFIKSTDELVKDYRELCEVALEVRKYRRVIEEAAALLKLSDKFK